MYCNCIRVGFSYKHYISKDRYYNIDIKDTQYLEISQNNIFDIFYDIYFHKNLV